MDIYNYTCIYIAYICPAYVNGGRWIRIWFVFFLCEEWLCHAGILWNDYCFHYIIITSHQFYVVIKHLSCDIQNITQCTYIITIASLTFFYFHYQKYNYFIKHEQITMHAWVYVKLISREFHMPLHWYFSCEFVFTWNFIEEKKFEIHVNFTCNSHVIFVCVREFHFYCSNKVDFHVNYACGDFASVPWSTFHD